jgi:pyruvate/2-oxoglutarate dehydrogenase complex dihydrolipoamide acyltransferase (E2) component
MPRDFILPDLGEGIHEAQIVRLLINEGDEIAQDQYLMEVETDKAAVEIPSPFAGVAKRVHVSEGQTVNVGAVLVTFGDAKDGAGVEAPPSEGDEGARGTGEERGVAAGTAERSARPTAAAPAAGPPAAGPPAAAKEDPRAEAGRPTTAPAAPAVRKLAREWGIDLDTVEGSGPGGRITREDLDALRSQRAASTAESRADAGGPPARRREPAFATVLVVGGSLMASAEFPPGAEDKDKWGEVRRVPLNQIRKTIASQMAKSAFTIPHVTHIDEVEITQLQETRQRLNEATGGNPKVTVTAFVIRALCIALRNHPVFNASFDEEGGQIIYKKYVNMGVAVDTPRGLVVPVIRNADRMSLAAIAAELRTISDKTRTNKFAIEDLRGGTFTITNVGALGGLFSTPIINHPEVAILGLGRSRTVAVIDGEELREAQMLPLSLSFDHRAIDGANAARFTTELMGYLHEPERLLLF